LKRAFWLSHHLGKDQERPKNEKQTTIQHASQSYKQADERTALVVTKKNIVSATVAAAAALALLGQCRSRAHAHMLTLGNVASVGPRKVFFLPFLRKDLRRPLGMP
jgi:hypothetical protein